MLRLIDLFKVYNKILIRNKVPEINNSLNILLTEYTKCKNINFKTLKSIKLTKSLFNKFKNKLFLRSLHFPIQYILGYWEFRSIKVKLKRGILIPRQETYDIIDIVKSELPQNFTFFEIGLGSGIISLSLTKELNCSGIACDINKQSINLVKNSIYYNNKKLQLKHMPFEIFFKSNNVKFDLIISNPPYVDIKDYNSLEKQIKKYENISALVSPNNGFYHCSKIIEQGYNFLTNNGKIILELDPIQINKIKNNKYYHSLYNIKIINDYLDRERFIVLRKI